MNEMINACTSLFPLLTYHERNSYYYNISIITFSLVSAANHILPENLDGMTHLVRQSFSNVLFSLIELNPILGFLLSLLDLTPLLSKKTSRFEVLMPIPRIGIEIFLIYNLFFTQHLDCIIMIICKFIYFFERKARIKKGNRNNYSTWHAAEHLGLFLLFKDITKVEFTLNSLIILFVFILVLWTLVGLFLHIFTRWLDYNMTSRAPQWILENSQLKSILKEKLLKNKNSLKYRNYILKSWTSHLKLEFVSWKKIDEICEELAKQVNPSNYDMVIGISTGGAFVGAHVARKLNKPFSIIQSKLWSGINFYENYTKVAKFVLGVEQKPYIMGEVPHCKNKRVLLVDDTTYTGITLNAIKKHIEKGGQPKSISTMVMWMRGNKTGTDYHYCLKRIPILWEWGAELD